MNEVMKSKDDVLDSFANNISKLMTEVAEIKETPAQAKTTTEPV